MIDDDPRADDEALFHRQMALAVRCVYCDARPDFMAQAGRDRWIGCSCAGQLSATGTLLDDAVTNWNRKNAERAEHAREWKATR